MSDPEHEAMFRDTQAARLESLRAEAADRPADAKFIDQLIDDPGNPDAPPADEVPPAVAEALTDDVEWVSTTPPDGFPSLYSHAYEDLRNQQDAEEAGTRPAG